MPKASWGAIDGNPFEDDLEDFEIYDGETPPKGVYRFRLKLLRLKKNKNDDPMFSGLLVINEPANSPKAKYNGFDCWFNLNITKQGAGWVNNFLAALVPEEKAAALKKSFWAQKVMLDKEATPNVVSIGTLKIADQGLLVSAQCTRKKDSDDELDPKRFFRPTDMTANDDEADEGDEEDWEDAEGTEEEPADGDDEADEEFDARAEELEALERPGLLKIAKALGLSTKRGTPESDIIDAILAEEFPEEDEEEPAEEDEDEEEELEEDPEDEEEVEEEVAPEPPKRTSRRRAVPAKAAAPATRRKAAPAKEEAPPAPRTRTGRRRKAGEPPF